MWQLSASLLRPVQLPSPFPSHTHLLFPKGPLSVALSFRAADEERRRRLMCQSVTTVSCQASKPLVVSIDASSASLPTVFVSFWYFHIAKAMQRTPVYHIVERCWWIMHKDSWEEHTITVLHHIFRILGAWVLLQRSKWLIITRLGL